MQNWTRKLGKKLIRFAGLLRPAAAEIPTQVTLPNRIAYFIAGGIGDGVMAWPAINRIRTLFPDATLDIFVPPAKAAVLSLVFDGFTVHPLDRRSIGSLILRRGHYDCCLTNTIAAFRLSCEFTAAWSGKRSFGFHYPDERPRDRAYGWSTPFAADIHDIDQNCDLVRAALGNAGSRAENRCYPSRDRLFPAARIAVLHPGVERGFENRRWATDRYISLAHHLIDRGYTVTILAGPSELDVVSTFTGMGVNVLGNPSAELFVRSIREAAIFVGNDSGPAHLAAFFGIPAVTLFGPADPRRTAPRSERGVIVSSHESCSPCHFTALICSTHRCMENITLEMVIEAAGRLGY